MEIQAMREVVQLMDEARFQMLTSAFACYRSENREAQNKVLEVVERLEGIIDSYVKLIDQARTKEFEANKRQRKATTTTRPKK